MYICVLSSTTTCVLTYVLKIWIFLLLYPFCIFYKLWFDYIVPEHSNASAWLYKAVAGLAGALASFQCVGHSTMDLDESWIMNVCAHVGGVLFRLCTCIYIDSLGRWAQAPLYIYPSRISLLLLHYGHTEKKLSPRRSNESRHHHAGSASSCRCCRTACCLYEAPLTPQTLCTGTAAAISAQASAFYRSILCCWV